MRLLVLFIILSYPIMLLAQSCLSNRKVNLADPGGSLYPMVASDQNGLGICHIEQLHKMLKAKLPGHPNLSRIQLSISDKKELDKNLLFKQTIRWKDKKGTIGGTYLDAGTSCESLNRIKGKSICLAAYDRFEQLTKMHPEYQEKIVNVLADYFDSKPKSNYPLSFLGVNRFSLSTEELTAAHKQCPVPEKNLVALKSAYKNFLKQIRSEFGFLSSVENTYLDKISWNRLDMSGEDLLKGKSYYDHIIGQLTHLGNQEFHESDLLRAEAKIFSIAMQAQESCVSDKIKQHAHFQNCNEHGEKKFKDVLDLTSYGLHLSEVLQILNGSEDRDDFFSNAFSCDGHKYKIPQSLNCKMKDLTTMAKMSKSEDEFIQSQSKVIMDYLVRGTPVGISVCTRFFNNPHTKTIMLGTDKFDCGDEKSPRYTKGEAGHAMTIIGSRCQNGSQEFLVQNSWGNGCFYSNKYECTHQGGFWAPAKTVLLNIRRFQTLE